MSGIGLSPLQQGMLYHHLRTPHSGVDIEQMVVRLLESVEPDAFHRAWMLLGNAHGIFRSSFVWEGLDQPLQIEHPHVDIGWQQHDLRGLTAAEQQQRLADFLRQDRDQGFDLKTPPLTRGALFQLDAAEWEFVWTFHHISADGQSYPTLIREAFAAYDALRVGATPQFSQPRPYRDFIAWLEPHLKQSQPQAKSFWQETLRGFTAPTPLPGTASAALGGHGLGERSTTLPGETTARLRAFAASHGLGMSTFLHGAWALLLSAHSNEADVLFGETRAGRRGTIPGADEIVGGLINTVPVRIRLDPNARVGEWLQEIRAFQIASRAVEHTPLSEIQRWSEVPAKTTLFETLIVFTPRLIGLALREQGGAWANRDVRFLEQTSFPLTLFAYNESALLLKLAYDRARLSDEAVERLLRQLTTVLEALALDPERRLADLPILGADERQLLAVDWNRTARRYENEQTIHGFFEMQAARTPEATAVAFRDESLSYCELNRRANRLARRLQSLGAGPDRIIGIFLKRSADMMVALLGVLKSGAAYLPLDPAFPEQRLAWMLEDTQAPIVVTQRDLADAVPAGQRTRILCLDGPDRAELEAELATDLGAMSGPLNLAYVIFTSGSTGRPKGVMVEHRNVANFFAGMDEALQFREPGTWLAVTSISFDISVLELFWTLARGFKVVIQEEALSLAPDDSAGAATGKMDLGLFYFAADAGEAPDNKYRLLMEGARYADANGFASVWTPERHFHAFGGLYPNPAVTSAAIAAITRHIQIRAGSIVLPLHNPIRVAEEWAVVDNLSGGRVGLSFASGWHANDFALMPQNYAARKQLTFDGIETVRRLWRGEAVTARSGTGGDIKVRIFPAALQKDPPVWVTAASNVETFRMAGEMGANLLTNLLGQKVEELAGKIAVYRAARRARGHAGDGIVSLMLHTFVGPDLDDVRRKVRRPFIEYLKTSTDLIKQARWEFPAFATAQGTSIDGDGLSPEDVDALMSHAFDRYFETSGLFGTPEICLRMISRLAAIGVNEVACLIDFGIDTDSVLESLTHLNEVRKRARGPDESDAYSIAAQLKRHAVTHLQCTPSLAGILLGDPDSAVALRPLRKWMLGGEALPPALAKQAAAAIAGDVVNMYGPTETTVWSATAAIDRSGGPITIGRPIANTQIYIVDGNLHLAPLGAAGELLIGGDGVTRGYLDRPELTADRFIPDPFGDRAGMRLYRTGDRARYREDGRIEFLGRLDHQAKIRGYRIELGEIEAALAAHPDVRENVVVVRETEAGERSLLAYVVLATSPLHAGQWQEIWDSAYSGDGAATDAQGDKTFNTAGWVSSYTGEPIADPEMREWVERTVERIGAIGPKRILEIGCGTGMLLFRLAPSCQHYHGVDFSAAALRHVQAEVDRQGLVNVTLQRAAADEMADLAPGSFDLVVLNSVVQYFPNADYLVKVLERILPALATEGVVFIGDVRNLRLLKAFHTAVELARAPAALSAAELRRRVEQRATRDNELVLDPDFFRALQQQFPAIGAVDIMLKRGRYHNEMTRFRYDVILRKSDSPFRDAADAEAIGGAVVLEDVRRRLDGAPARAAFAGLRNPRLTAEIRAADMLESEDCPATAGAIRESLASMEEEGIDPEALHTLDASYDIQLTWSSQAADRYDAVFRHRTAASPLAKSTPVAAKPRRAWSDYANARDVKTLRSALPGELKELVKRRLPDYMVPAAIVVLDSLPRTPNGKLDRKALPAPDRAQTVTAVTYAAPETDLETAIANVWRDVLSVERVGAHDNFFDLGANSLIMMQANARLKELLKRNLRLVDLFQYPTVSALAAHVSRANDEGGTAIEASQQRGQARLDALRRRRVDARK